MVYSSLIWFILGVTADITSPVFHGQKSRTVSCQRCGHHRNPASPYCACVKASHIILKKCWVVPFVRYWIIWAQSSRFLSRKLNKKKIEYILWNRMCGFKESQTRKGKHMSWYCFILLFCTFLHAMVRFYLN